MTTPPNRKRTLPKILFIAALATMAITIVYASIRKSQWNWPVPEEAKELKNPIQPSPAVLESARQIYSDKCAECHGDTGRGDGRKAFTIDPTPFDFTDTKRMNGVTDGELFYKISEGKKPMPVFKTRLTENQRWELVLLIRSFAASAGPSGQPGAKETQPAVPAVSGEQTSARDVQRSTSEKH